DGVSHPQLSSLVQDPGSTEACGVSACRNTGSWTWTTPERSSPAGGRTTTTFDPTAAWVIVRPSTSGLAEPSPPPPRGSKTHPRSGPKLGEGQINPVVPE